MRVKSFRCGLTAAIWLVAGFVVAERSVAAPGVPGDFDVNGFVDASDFVLWRNAVGTGTPLPNNNGLPPQEDNGHHELWKSNYGEAAGAGTGFEAAAPTGIDCDYNENGVCDAADYVIWRDESLAATGPRKSDGDHSGSIDQADYDLWRDGFGNTSGAGAGVEHARAVLSTVPEPDAAALAIIGVLGGIVFAARRRG